MTARRSNGCNVLFLHCKTMPLPQRIKKQNSSLDSSAEPVTRVINEVRISTATIIKIVAVVVVLVLLWTIKEVLGILFVALVFASALDPWVDTLRRYRIPRGLSILAVYILLLAAVGFVIAIVIPPLVSQISDIAGSFTDIVPQLESFYRRITQDTDASMFNEIQRGLLNLSSNLTNLTTGVFGAVTGVFGGIVTFLLVLVITFYMTIEEDGIKKFVRSIAPIKFQPYLVQKANRIQIKMGGWLRGQLILMCIIGVLSYIGLLLLGVKYALVLAVIAGLAEFIPFIGPIIAAIPAVFFAYADSPWKALGVIIFYTLLQQLENQILVPKVMQRAVGLNPIVVISAMLVGAQIAGVVGIILAVPAATIAWIFIEDIFEQKRAEDNRLEEPTGEVNDEEPA